MCVCSSVKPRQPLLSLPLGYKYTPLDLLYLDWLPPPPFFFMMVIMIVIKKTADKITDYRSSLYEKKRLIVGSGQ